MEKSKELLAQLHSKLDRSHPVCVPRAAESLGAELCSWSIFTDVSVGPASWGLLDRFAEDAGCDSALGCLLGLALGDAVGGPLEFCPVDANQDCLEDERRPHVASTLIDGQLSYKNVRNKFDLKLGQWTDDASMALCLADSLLTCGSYHGGDARLRWHMWWFHGYCNAFRYDHDRRKGQSSVGLGMNVAKSFAEIERSVQHAQKDGRLPKGTSHATVVPPVHQSDSNDAGNGSIMRLAPVPIAYHLCPGQALDVASWQSLATHPGPEAALCCRFMASFCVEAISRRRNAMAVDSELAVLDPIGEPRVFLASQIEKFLKHSESCGLPPGLDEGGAAERMQQLLKSTPPSRKEALWNWKAPRLAIDETVAARRGSSGNDLYNGHPTTPSYFGAYCMDGLAMALWALWNSKSFASAVVKAVNLLGDADTVGAIVGQMAGAMYGWKHIAADEWSSRCVRNLMHWDKGAEIGLRAVLLYHRGPRPKARLLRKVTFEGIELAPGQTVTCLDASADGYLVVHEGVQGWVHDLEFLRAEGTEDLERYITDTRKARRDASPPPIPKEPAPRKTLRDFKLPSLFGSRK